MRIGILTVAAGALVAAGLAVAPAQASSAPAFRHACAPAHGSRATCFAVYRHVSGARANAAPAAGAPTGYGPAQIASAYKLPTSAGAGRTVAIVDAYDNPKAEADLAVFRKHFGLPACTTANGCFRKVNQKGAASPLPPGDPDWGVETSLDLDAVSSACPRCRILLVEGDSDFLDDLGIAAARAAGMGVAAVSNSYGTTEFNGMSAYAKYYTHPGVPITASTGDYGFQAASFPAVLTTTIAVGGTTLKKASNSRGWKETAWSGAGSGCSAYVAKPSWQKDRHCLMRTIGDVSAVADPDTGLGTYDTYGLGSDNGWNEVGGTSLSSPLIAGMFGLAGNGATINNAAYLYARRRAFHDVVGGTNGFCGGDYLCRGTRGYDAPTGIGTPKGVGGL